MDASAGGPEMSDEQPSDKRGSSTPRMDAALGKGADWMFAQGCQLEREAERYRHGMENWKATAEAKDAQMLAASATQATTALTFDAFRRANVARCLKWHPAGIESWSASDWLTAVTGELGELASLLKMRNRERDGLPGNKFSPSQKQIADELADVLTYLDLLAEALGVNLGRAAVEKFNEVSERVGFPDRIPAVPDSTAVKK